MFSSRIDARSMIAEARGFSGSIVSSTVRALNDSAFAARAAWQKEAVRVFDRPTPFTINAVLVRKATPQLLQSEVFIRDEASGGTAPSEYLLPEVEGGQRKQKPFEFLSNRLRATKFTPYYIPGRDFPRDAYGNIPAGVIRQIQSQLGVAESVAGFAANESSRTRRSRLRRQKKRGIRGGNFFVLEGPHGKLKPHVVYERVQTGFGSTVRTALYGVDQAPRYRKRYNVIALARNVFASEFANRFARYAKGLR